jgi:hypothetical protein
VCTTQPTIAVVYVTSGEIAYAFQGSLYVNIAESPTGYEKLYYGANGCISDDDCGEVVTNTLASTAIINGIANFQVKNWFLSP